MFFRSAFIGTGNIDLAVGNLKPTTVIGYSREIPTELPQFSQFFHKNSFLYASGTLAL
jgi:hypothetical protein